LKRATTIKMKVAKVKVKLKTIRTADVNTPAILVLYHDGAAEVINSAFYSDCVMCARLAGDYVVGIYKMQLCSSLPISFFP